MTATLTAPKAPARRAVPPSPEECRILAASFGASLRARRGRRMLARLTLVQLYRGEEKWVGRG